MDPPIIDYYKILQCDRNATQEELKKKYQSLVLTFHPDKKKAGRDYEKFIDIQKAWSVLRDPESRKQYDALLASEEHRELLLYDTVSLSDMNFNSSNNVFTYQCRCGGIYSVAAIELKEPKIFLECDECSLSLQVEV